MTIQVNITYLIVALILQFFLIFLVCDGYENIRNKRYLNKIHKFLLELYPNYTILYNKYNIVLKDIEHSKEIKILINNKSIILNTNLTNEKNKSNIQIKCSLEIEKENLKENIESVFSMIEDK